MLFLPTHMKESCRASTSWLGSSSSLILTNCLFDFEAEIIDEWAKCQVQIIMMTPRTSRHLLAGTMLVQP
eukprot:4717412-Amphidinium_carterae.1